MLYKSKLTYQIVIILNKLNFKVALLACYRINNINAINIKILYEFIFYFIVYLILFNLTQSRITYR